MHFIPKLRGKASGSNATLLVRRKERVHYKKIKHVWGRGWGAHSGNSQMRIMQMETSSPRLTRR